MKRVLKYGGVAVVGLVILTLAGVLYIDEVNKTFWDDGEE